MVAQDREVQEFLKRICSWALSIALVIAVLFLVLGERAVAKGLLLGTCFSILNFVLLGKSIPMALGKSRAKANIIGFGSILTRYAVLAVPIVIAVKSPSFDLVAVIIGVFAVQMMIFLDHFVLSRRQGDSKVSSAR